MPETSQIMFTVKELTEILIKKQAIHSGLWSLAVKMGFGAVNVPSPPNDLVPAGIVSVLEVGLQKNDTPTQMTVDAAQVNPVTARAHVAGKRKRGKQTPE